MRRLISVTIATIFSFTAVVAIVTSTCYAAAVDGMQINVLSNQADLISGGDALVESGTGQ